MRYLALLILIVNTAEVFCQDTPSGRYYPKIRERSLDSLALEIIDTNSIQIIPLIDQNPKSEWYSVPAHFTDGSGKWIREERLEDDYLIYIINVSKSDLQVMSYERNGFYIQQEAKDKSGNWRGIEDQYHSACALAYDALVVKSRKAYSTFAKKYPGDFETEVRLKLMVFSPSSDFPKYIYSKPFKMKIDSKRLEKKFYSTN